MESNCKDNNKENVSISMFPYQAIKIVNTNFISNLTYFIFFNHRIIASCVSYKKPMEIIIILQS